MVGTPASNKSGRILSKLFPRKLKRLKKATAVEGLRIVEGFLKQTEMEVKRMDLNNAKKSIMGAKAVIVVMIEQCEAQKETEKKGND